MSALGRNFSFLPRSGRAKKRVCAKGVSWRVRFGALAFGSSLKGKSVRTKSRAGRDKRTGLVRTEAARRRAVSPPSERPSLVEVGVTGERNVPVDLRKVPTG